MRHLLTLSLLLVAGCSSAPAPVAPAPKTPDARARIAEAVASLPASRFDKPGFKAVEANGRLTVFRTDAAEAAAFAKSRELGKGITQIGAGPDGMTIMAPDTETLTAWRLAKPGFATRIVDGRLWVFAAPSKEWDEFQATGSLAKHITRVGAGPEGMTVKAADGAVIDAWLSSK